MERPLLIGAVAYAPKVVTIWDGFREWFARHDLAIDHILYSDYERQVEALMAGQIDIAWNSPLAWVRSRRLAEASGRAVSALAMRDTDRDLRSAVVVLAGSAVRMPADLAGLTIGVGAGDSPQATLLPIAHLEASGLPSGAAEIRTFDVLVGKHGDHVGGERLAAAALAAGEVAAACMIESNYAAFRAEGLLDPPATRLLCTTGAYDHCNFTVIDTAPAAQVERFRRLLLGMSADDPELAELFELEGLGAWCPGRTGGYAPLESAVDATGYYDAAGGRGADAGPARVAQR